ncbi:MAG TPA: PEGA domain-containing protein [Bryobacteraceae bacterium]|nr:PEGA domain-containing protein [Bryobacteraceae bacterium]
MSALSALAAGQVAWAGVTIPNGTKLSCRLEQTISSATAEEGQQVQLSVTDPVRINGVVVIPQGAPVLGTIVMAQGKRSMGRSGKLDFSVDKVRAADGAFVPLRYHMNKKQGEGKGMSTGIMTAGAAVLFWPAAPFFLMRKGKDININKGIVFEVFTDQDHDTGGATVSGPVAPAPPQTLATQPQVMLAAQQQVVPAAATPAELATVNITSDLPGAEVEVDGVFVGSTPASTKLAPGVHKVQVKHGSAAWSRDLMVQPNGTVNVNAILRK